MSYYVTEIGFHQCWWKPESNKLKLNKSDQKVLNLRKKSYAIVTESFLKKVVRIHLSNGEMSFVKSKNRAQQAAKIPTSSSAKMYQISSKTSLSHAFAYHSNPANFCLNHVKICDIVACKQSRPLLFE